jgi:hypothetical protein
MPATSFRTKNSAKALARGHLRRADERRKEAARRARGFGRRTPLG